MTPEPDATASTTLSSSSGAGEEWQGLVADGGEPLPASNREVGFDGRIWSVVSEDVHFPGTTARRDVVLHPGAVAIIAIDAHDRVLLIRQYRHPVGQFLFEPPAGLMDALDESGRQTAERELGEEAGLRARTWHVLLDVFLSPGGTSEAIRIFLARDLDSLEGGRIHTGEAEEAHLPRAWVPLEEAKELVLTGALASPSAAAGILAAWAARDAGWDSLRPATAPWEARDRLIAHDRVRLPGSAGSWGDHSER
ncbi:MAG: NUDIX hydrolase [Candidatus Nanopelagicales bacterium]|nr:NUDIX hydrolase [Candidatus Nanopelagicales bacterium]